MLQRVSDSLPFKGWIILHWMYWPYSAYPSACWETLEWPLPLDCCEWCCHKFGCTNTSVRPGFQFIRMHIPRSRIAGSYGSCIFNFFILNITLCLLISFVDVLSLQWQQGVKKKNKIKLSSCMYKCWDIDPRWWWKFLSTFEPTEGGLMNLGSHWC